MKQILDELENSRDNYCKALSLSKNEDLELPLKKQSNSCSVNYYFDGGLKAWQANTNLQHVSMSKSQ